MFFLGASGVSFGNDRDDYTNRLQADLQADPHAARWPGAIPAGRRRSLGPGHAPIRAHHSVLAHLARLFIFLFQLK